MKDCLFCGISAGDTDTKLLYEDDQIVAFDDIAPQASTHLLIVPKRHIASTLELNEEHEALIGHMVRIGTRQANNAGLADDGFRFVINTGPHAGQTVDHIHLHLLGGQQLGSLV